MSGIPVDTTDPNYAIDTVAEAESLVLYLAEASGANAIAISWKITPGKLMDDVWNIKSSTGVDVYGLSLKITVERFEIAAEIEPTITPEEAEGMGYGGAAIGQPRRMYY